MGYINHALNSLSHCAITNFKHFISDEIQRPWGKSSYFRRMISDFYFTVTHIFWYSSRSFSSVTSRCGLALKGYFTEFHHTEPDSQYVWWWEGIKPWMCVKRRRVKMRKKANLEQNRWTNKHRENTTTGSGWDIVWQKAMAHWEIDANNMQMMQAMKSAGEENILVKK